MEAEYSALSMAMRAAIPLLQIVRHILQGFNIGDLALTQFKTTIHEDNQSCLKLALLPAGQMTPRSKFYAIKMHWFRSWLKPNKIELQYISTKLQKADMFTKSLTVADLRQIVDSLWVGNPDVREGVSEDRRTDKDPHYRSPNTTIISSHNFYFYISKTLFFLFPCTLRGAHPG